MIKINIEFDFDKIWADDEVLSKYIENTVKDEITKAIRKELKTNEKYKKALDNYLNKMVELVS